VTVTGRVAGRVLVDWDWGAHGIWSIRSAAAPRPWAELLTEALLGDLQVWNDDADSLYGPRAARSTPGTGAQAAFWEEGRRLAERVQGELGPTWQVLYNCSASAGGWAWAWVRPPWDD
jgi:hypothetical protein